MIPVKLVPLAEGEMVITTVTIGGRNYLVIGAGLPEGTEVAPTVMEVEPAAEPPAQTPAPKPAAKKTAGKKSTGKKPSPDSAEAIAAAMKAMESAGEFVKDVTSGPMAKPLADGSGWDWEADAGEAITDWKP